MPYGAAVTPKDSSKQPVIDTPLEGLLTEQEYAGLVKRSLASVRRDRFLRTGCAWVKIGRLVRYRPCDTRAYIERNLHNPVAVA
jgi:hypothetical protein